MFFLIRPRSPPLPPKKQKEKISGLGLVHAFFGLGYIVIFVIGLIWSYDEIMELGIVQFLEAAFVGISLIIMILSLLPRFGKRMQDKDPRQ